MAIKEIPEDLIKAAQKGDSAAMLQLIKRCQPDLYKFARKTCSTSEDAEDAVQVALWVLFKKIGTLRTIAKFSSWLFRIVERECYRIFRKTPRINSLNEDRTLAIAAKTAPLELQMDLSHAIMQLPEKYRTVLVLRAIQGLTTPEVAEALDISVEAVKSRLHRARGMVRGHLQSNDYWVDN